VDGLRVSDEAIKLFGDFLGCAAGGDAGGLLGSADQDAQAAIDEAGVVVGRISWTGSSMQKLSARSGRNYKRICGIACKVFRQLDL